ncbi:MAG: HAD-IA family hydrolase [Minwuiales bacterium]|nr:HAD-IA family hydrolase [Minwuiales bacterium]
MAWPPTLVIFDCDGVLVDSELPANRTFRLMLAEQGLELSLAETVGLLKGLSLPACGALLKERFGLVLPDDFFERLQQRTYQAFQDELNAVPGVQDAVEGLALPFCVASSGAIEKMHFTLGLTGLLELFRDRMFSAEQVARGKPFPDLFLHAAAQMGHSPDACVVIEDSLPGVKAAQAAGMTVLGFAGTELADADELGAAGATVFSDMRDLAALLA